MLIFNNIPHWKNWRFIKPQKESGKHFVLKKISLNFNSSNKKTSEVNKGESKSWEQRAKMWCNIHQWVCQTCCRGAEPISQAEGGNLLCLRRPEASRLSLRAWNTSRASSEVDKNTSLSLTAFFCETQVCVQKKTKKIKGLCKQWHVIVLTVHCGTRLPVLQTVPAYLSQTRLHREQQHCR